MSPRILGAPFITAASILLGCNFPTELPIRYETEHLEIGTEFDDSLFCRGDLLELERRVARTEDELEFTLKETYTVYVWSDESWGSGAAKNCGPGDALGCTRKSRATIWTTRFSLEHELVHAVIGKSRLHPFFEEGLAEVYGGGQTRFGQSAPSANSSTDRASADVQTAAHFLRWLRERWGPHYLALLARTEDGFDDFEAVYGMSINAAEQLYFAEAPYAYAAFDDCDAGDLAAADIADRWVDQIELDCDAGADTLNAGDGIIVHRSLNISEAGYYSVMTDCGQVCANLGPAWTTSSCDEYECVCVPTDPLSCWPGEVNCVSEEVLQQCSDSQLWEAMECVQLCAAKGLISAGCNEQVDPLTGDHRADCWCSGEDTPCAPGTPPICVDKVSIASCVDGSWLFQDCTDLCAGPGQCVPWQQPATCEC